MHFLKVDTSDQVVRWINFEQVSRVTLGLESPGVPIVAIVFASGDTEEALKIRGTDDTNRKAIEKITEALDILAKS